MDELQQELFKLQDLKYRDFHSKLMPGIDKETIIGIRTPVLRKFAKEFAKTEAAEAFLQELPHTYYEENNLFIMLLRIFFHLCTKVGNEASSFNDTLEQKHRHPSCTSRIP